MRISRKRQSILTLDIKSEFVFNSLIPMSINQSDADFSRFSESKIRYQFFLYFTSIHARINLYFGWYSELMFSNAVEYGTSE